MSTTLLKKRADELKAAHAIIGAAAGRDLTDVERDQLVKHESEILNIDDQIAKAKADADLLSRLGSMVKNFDDNTDTAAVKSIGEFFVKTAGNLGLLRRQQGTTLGTDFYQAKAATDVNTIGSVWDDALTDTDNALVRKYRRRLYVADVFGSGTVAGDRIKYFVQHPTGVEGAFTTVAEGGQKPQLHFLDPTATTDELKKMAAWWDISEEMVEDIPFMVSEINGEGLYQLALFEEDQLLLGDGTGNNILGALNRSGVQTHAQGTDTVADAMFKAAGKVHTATGLVAEAVMIHPTNYESLRLSKDANGQYFGGGFFTGPYGQGGIMENPPIWGLRTVVTTAVPLNTYAIGAWTAATKVFRKGGVRVESTNSDASKFTKNIITMRMEQRIGLQVKRPAAIVKGTLV